MRLRTVARHMGDESAAHFKAVMQTIEAYLRNELIFAGEEDE